MDDPKPKQLVRCCIKNCQREIPLEEALEIDEKYFCKTCGVQYYRKMLKL